VALSCTSRINVGLIALALSWGLGSWVAGLKPEAVLLWLWGRRPDAVVELDGEPAALTAFRDRLRIATQ